MTSAVFVPLVVVALAGGLPPPPILDDPAAAAPVLDDDAPSRDPSDEASGEGPKHRRPLPVHGGLASDDDDRDPGDVVAAPEGGAFSPLTVGLLQGVTGLALTTLAGVLVVVGVVGATYWAGTSNAPCACIACVLSGGMICALPAVLGILQTTVGNALLGQSKSALLPVLASYVAFGLDLGLLAVVSAAFVFNPSLLPLGFATVLALAVGLLALAPMMAYPFADEATDERERFPSLFPSPRDQHDDTLF